MAPVDALARQSKPGGEPDIVGIPGRTEGAKLALAGPVFEQAGAADFGLLCRSRGGILGSERCLIIGRDNIELGRIAGVGGTGEFEHGLNLGLVTGGDGRVDHRAHRLGQFGVGRRCNKRSSSHCEDNRTPPQRQ